MVSYKGLEVLTSLVKTEEEEEVQMRALDSLLTLAQNMERTGHKRKYSLTEETSLPPTKTLSSANAPEVCLCLLPELHPLSCQHSHCKYHDSDHCPFDMTVLVGPTDCSVQLPVHRSVLVEASDVFAVMLEGQYRESSDSEVFIRGVPPLAFKSLVHHVYGCGWLCPTVLEEVLHQDSEDSCDHMSDVESDLGDLTAAITESVIGEITSSFEFLEDSRSVRHCLQVLACAGQFLLPELCIQCERFATSYLSHVNVVPVFHFAQFHQNFYLAQRCIRCLVTMPHSDVRRRVFRDLVMSSEGTAALKMVESLLTKKL